MKKFLNLLLAAALVISCQQSSYQKSGDLPKQVEVAILLPTNDQQGQKMDKFITAGLQDGAARNLSINTYEVANEADLPKVMQKLLDNKTDVILGPVTSDLTKKAINATEGRNVTIISLSNDPSLADKNVYVFGHGPLQQSSKLLKYLKNAGINNIIFLLPDNRQSINLSKALRDIALNNEISVVGMEKYLDTAQSVNQALENIEKIVNELNEDSVNLSKAAIYVLDEAEKLRILFDKLVNLNLDKKAIICGENKIDIDYTEPIDLVFTGTINKPVETKVLKHAQATYLSWWDKLAYDLGLITSDAIGSDNFNKILFLRRLNNLNGYEGLSGSTHMIDSIAKREYEIIKRSGVEYNIAN